MPQDTEEEPIAKLQPLRMHFPPAEYNKRIILSTRSYIHEVLKTIYNLNHPFTNVERNWFENHPHFKHIFSHAKGHKPQCSGHVDSFSSNDMHRKKKEEAWFVVNGAPIHYGIEEHTLISRLDCHNYPLDYKKA